MKYSWINVAFAGRKDYHKEETTTKNYTFNIDRLTSVFGKTDVNTNTVAYL